MRSTRLALGAGTLGLLLAAAHPLAAQSIHLSPLVGAFHPTSDLNDLRGARIARDNAFALGLNVDVSFLRASLAYASGARITDDGIGNGDEIGDGSLLALTGDVVLRPIPRLIVLQPYLIGGAGLKRESYSFDDDGLGDLLPEDATDFAWHVGLGADLMLGNFGLVAEVSDFITSGDDDTFGRHDTFAMVGLRFRLF
jgi:hypothetical protein